MNNKGADQTVWMHRLVCAFVVRKHRRQVFSHRGPYEVYQNCGEVRHKPACSVTETSLVLGVLKHLTSLVVLDHTCFEPFVVCDHLVSVLSKVLVIT